MTDPEKRKQLRRVGLEIIDHATDDKRDVDTSINQAVQTLRLMLPAEVDATETDDCSSPAPSTRQVQGRSTEITQ